MTKEEFASSVMRLAGPQEPFKPSATYIPTGDCIEFVWAPDDYVAHRIDGLVTVYKSRKTGEVVGGVLKGIQAFCKMVCKRLPGFRAFAGPVRLEHIFLVHLWSEPPRPSDKHVVRAYEELAEVAQARQVDVDIAQACQAAGK
jgi:hypothetical protein